MYLFQTSYLKKSIALSSSQVYLHGFSAFSTYSQLQSKAPALGSESESTDKQIAISREPASRPSSRRAVHHSKVACKALMTFTRCCYKTSRPVRRKFMRRSGKDGDKTAGSFVRCLNICNMTWVSLQRHQPDLPSHQSWVENTFIRVIKRINKNTTVK